jgi:hypothetical protein
MSKKVAILPTHIDALRSGSLADKLTSGLSIEVLASGKKRWKYRRQVAGTKVVAVVFGGLFPAQPIADAREWARGLAEIVREVCRYPVEIGPRLLHRLEPLGPEPQHAHEGGLHEVGRLVGREAQRKPPRDARCLALVEERDVGFAAVRSCLEPLPDLQAQGRARAARQRAMLVAMGPSPDEARTCRSPPSSPRTSIDAFSADERLDIRVDHLAAGMHRAPGECVGLGRGLGCLGALIQGAGQRLESSFCNARPASRSKSMPVNLDAKVVQRHRGPYLQSIRPGQFSIQGIRVAGALSKREPKAPAQAHACSRHTRVSAPDFLGFGPVRPCFFRPRSRE